VGTWNGIELDDVIIVGDRLTLRPWYPEDASSLVSGLADERMHEFLVLPHPYTEADARAWTTDLGWASRRTGTGLGVAVADTESDRVVGSADLRLPAARTATADIGYAIYPAGQGNGYAAELSLMLAAWAFAHAVPRVQIRAAVGNLGSIKSAGNAGFRFEGIERNAVLTPRGPADAAVFARVASDPTGALAPNFAPLPDGGLSDGVVSLRVFLPGDADAVMATDNDEQSLRWSFTGQPQTHDGFVASVERARLNWLVGQQAAMAVVDVATGAVAGNVIVRRAGPPGVGGIGYAIHPSWRGRGYTARALRLLRSWALNDAGFNRLELGAKRENVASQRAARSGGFLDDGIRIGRLRNPDGSFSDEVRFASFSPL
jgi:RimJ/RimL family protein N-acetyltransferase